MYKHILTLHVHIHETQLTCAFDKLVLLKLHVQTHTDVTCSYTRDTTNLCIRQAGSTHTKRHGRLHGHITCPGTAGQICGQMTTRTLLCGRLHGHITCPCAAGQICGKITTRTLLYGRFLRCSITCRHAAGQICG